MPLKIRALWFGNKGQAVILSLILLPVCLTLFSQVLYFSRMIERKIMLQNGIDAALLSGITFLAQGLNQIRTLNKQLLYCHRLLLLAQAGSVLTGNGGMILTEKTLRVMIKTIATQQDVIQKTYPLLAAQKIFILAKKNGTPHIFLSPPILFYHLERLPPRNSLPYLYQLAPHFSSHNTWHIRGNLYKGSYKAKAGCALSKEGGGKDLLHNRWKGVFIE